MNLTKTIGLNSKSTVYPDDLTVQYINLKLAAMGCPMVKSETTSEFHLIAESLLAHHRERGRLLSNYLCPVDWRIQQWLDEYIYEISPLVKLPRETLVLDRHGLARALSLPLGKDEFKSEIGASYRIKQGVLHNPARDRRTTKGVFHVAEGGLPIPADKIAVPLKVFANMLRCALNPPEALLQLPFTASQDKSVHCFVSLLLRPTVCPEVPGFTSEKSMEIRFFAPGTLVSNLDFVESIFGNAGDPLLPENDAGLDVDRWTGHSGCVILAPHLTTVLKKEIGLPRWEDATDRQRDTGMCWKKDDEPYNGGLPFKLCARDENGVMVTLIADNYFGYCKKEVKTQISFSANLYGLAEEEHAGGAVVYPSYDLGEEFSGHRHVKLLGHTFEEAARLCGDLIELQPNGYGIDKRFSDIIYVSENVDFDLNKQQVTWSHEGKQHSLKLLPGKTFVRPSGYKVRMEKPPGKRSWRLVGTVAEGLVCHKPCTVSGGGKSEISKPITDAVIQGPVFIADFKNDFDRVAELLEKDYSGRFKDSTKLDKRSILSQERSLGSVIKLLTPSRQDNTEEFNEWLESIPQYLKEIVFVVKRYYKPEWGQEWREHFSVDVINGKPGNELKCDNRKLVTHYLRVGFQPDGLWRTFGLRKDFHPAMKESLEDDISASVVVPGGRLSHLKPEHEGAPIKFVKNCEYRFFQRPDDAIHRGFDKQTERDFSQPGNFVSNFEPLDVAQAQDLIEDAIGFVQFTEPMQRLIRDAASSESPRFFVSSAHPRIVDGKPTKNPRYLQTRPDLLDERGKYLAEVCARLHRRIPSDQPLFSPVDAVVPGRRNNPADERLGIRPLSAYNPIHYMELPELFMEFICSMTGKSPSTTGAGSEGALTKGPFNALPPIIDLNNALVGYLLTGQEGFVTAAGYVGPQARVGHDISVLIPEVWCRMSPAERRAEYLIENGCLERCADLVHDDRPVFHSRLGYRITRRFVREFFGRVFNHPHEVLSDGMLRPELQDLASFVDSIDNIVATQKRVAQAYFVDGSIEAACPPLKALLHIMRDDEYEGKTLEHPDIRKLFTRQALEGSDWYLERLKNKQRFDVSLWTRHVEYVRGFVEKESHTEEAERLGIRQRLEHAEAELSRVQGPSYLESLKGTLGLQGLSQIPG